MTISPDQQVLIRPPLFTRIYVAVFVTVWLAFVVALTLIHRHGPSPVVGVVFVVFGVGLGYSLLRLGVRSGPDGVLVVRNSFSSRRLTREEIEGFQIGTNSGGRLGQSGVQAVLHDGTAYGFDVCRTPFGFGSQRLNNQLDQLNAWLHPGP